MKSLCTALQIMMAINGCIHERVASILQKMGMLQFCAGNLESGRNHLEKAVTTYQQNGKGFESRVIAPLFVIGNINNLLQQAETARLVWTEVFDMIKSHDGEDDFSEIQNVLSELLHVNDDQ